MKCISWKSDGSIQRVDNDKAARLVKQGDAKYIAKKLWKEQIRKK